MTFIIYNQCDVLSRDLGFSHVEAGGCVDESPKSNESVRVLFLYSRAAAVNTQTFLTNLTPCGFMKSCL
jgi:hypothetical protein